MDHTGRLGRARVTLESSRLDALLVTYLPNVRYLCGFSGSAGVLIVSRGQSGRDSVFFTDGRYTQQAQQEVSGARIKILRGKSPLAGAADWLAQQRSGRRIGIDAAHLTVAERRAFAGSLRGKAKRVGAPAT